MTTNRKSRPDPFRININVPNSPAKLGISSFIDKKRISKNYKAPNGFLLYRNEISRVLIGHKFNRMSEVSKVASRYWRIEDKSVKDNYINIAKNLNNEVFDLQTTNINHEFVEILTSADFRT